MTKQTKQMAPCVDEVRVLFQAYPNLAKHITNRVLGRPSAPPAHSSYPNDMECPWSIDDVVRFLQGPAPYLRAHDNPRLSRERLAYVNAQVLGIGCPVVM